MRLLGPVLTKWAHVKASPASDCQSRKCHRCKAVFPLTREFFLGDRTRPSGLSYECKLCHRARKAGRDRRKERWSNLTPEQRDATMERRKRYGRTDKGRAIFLRKAYQRTDACDLTSGEVLALILKPCVHCGTTDLPRGLDRIDNSLPHTKGNVAPSCFPCNVARGDRFTFEEMQRIGAVMRQVLLDRISGTAQNADHPASSSPRPM